MVLPPPLASGLMNASRRPQPVRSLMPYEPFRLPPWSGSKNVPLDFRLAIEADFVRHWPSPAIGRTPNRYSCFRRTLNFAVAVRTPLAS